MPITLKLYCKECKEVTEHIAPSEFTEKFYRCLICSTMNIDPNRPKWKTVLDKE